MSLKKKSGSDKQQGIKGQQIFEKVGLSEKEQKLFSEIIAIVKRESINPDQDTKTQIEAVIQRVEEL